MPAPTPECIALTPDGPLQITPDCIDPIYNTPIITSATDETSPVPHHKVSGYFNNTLVDFNIYFPPKTKQSWSSRFFQLVYPLQNSTAEDESIAFSVDSGAYTLRVAGRVGYRGEAAAAKFSRRVACQYYEGKDTSCERIYGYIYGGSGGSLQTIGAMENTIGVWDGGLALVQAVPISNPNNFGICALATLVLESKAELVGDALRPGGSGDPFTGLESHERLVLEEVTALGVPFYSWDTFSDAGAGRAGLYEVMRTLVIATVKGVDPGYVEDFWNREGYAGAEDSDLGRFFRGVLVEYNDTVQSVELGGDGVPVGITLSKVPQGSPIGLEFTILDEDHELGSFTGIFNETDKSVSIYSDNNATILAYISEGAQLQINNRWYLAVHTYHRHQVPPAEDGYYGYDYLRDANGEPLYPQRDIFLAPTNSISASGGGTHTGNIKAKVIVMDNLLDNGAFPWHADWYKHQVQAALGDQFDDNYRLYFNEHADHFMGPVAQASQTRIVDFTGLYEQLLRDLSGWVEEGREPPLQTQYQVENGQVIVPASASNRGGIQPAVVLTVNAANRTDIDAGDSVRLKVTAKVPPGAGKIVSVEWDFYGTGGFVAGDLGQPCEKLSTVVRHVYDTAGTYLPAVRVASHRDGDTDTLFARALNLGRARVVVH
ncbi:hypothetical protein BJX63DRAFT_445034 [Aspergillus granulosus]|uniref:PKD domain-containing protein n=1 Tax=Aspergillus granulosus TaxID=176169 RepID=A0ABR4H348_9EURO